MCQDRDLAAVEHAPADAPVRGQVGVGSFPVSCGGECAGGGGQEDGPQPASYLAVFVAGGGHGGRGDADAVDDDVGAGGDGGVDCVDEGVGAGAVSGADAEPGEVDQVFEGLADGLSVQGPGAQVQVGVSVAPVAGEVGRAAVGGEQGGAIVDGGRLRPVAGACRLPCVCGQFRDASR
ncbi:hypothetical protein ACFRCG_03620 [Embleya sp. NPDC056575]|uniref:hypothetical protein n=1 Tax=unclassified Embleya TaxID=2699296 RepID=UPI0036BA6C1F